MVRLNIFIHFMSYFDHILRYALQFTIKFAKMSVSEDLKAMDV